MPINGRSSDPQSHPIALEEVPEPFRQVIVGHHLGPIDLLLYSPPPESDRQLGASILAVTSTGWMALEEAPNGGMTIHRASYDGTLLLELTRILQSGTLRIDYVAEEGVRSIVLNFSTVPADVCEDAVYRILGSIDNQPAHFIYHGESNAQLDTLPPQLHHTAIHYLPVGRRLLSVVHWPSGLNEVLRSPSEELAPEATLLLTDRELMLISEERTRPWLRLGKPALRYGHIITYMPLVRLGDCRVDGESLESIVVLEIDLYAGPAAALGKAAAADIVRVGVPREMFHDVAALINEISNQRLRLGSPSLG